MRFATLLWCVAGMLLTTVVSALGTVSIAKKEIQEVEGRWKIVVTLDVGKPPEVNYVPMIFTLTPVASYERALTDATGDKPVMRIVPLQGQTPHSEGMEVGFSDSSGKAFSKTKFDFKVKRERGYEAGEYELRVRRAADGVAIGRPLTLKLQGDNPVVDRRAMVFGAEKKTAEGDVRKVESDEFNTKGKQKSGSKQSSPDDTGAQKGAHTESESASVDSAPEPTVGEVPSVPPKQGGCGCRMAGQPSPGHAWLVAALGSGLLLRRRQRAAKSR